MKKLISLSLIISVLLSCAVLRPAAKETKLIDKTIYLFKDKYLEEFCDDEYRYSYSVSDRECIKVENNMGGGEVELVLRGKKLTSGGKKPIITIYRQKNGSEKQAYKRYRVTVKNPPTITKSISVNKNALELTGLGNYEFTKELTFTYTDKSVARLEYGSVHSGNIYDSSRYQNGTKGLCVKGLKYGKTRARAYIKGTKLKVGDFKITVKSIKPTIKKKYKTVNLRYSKYGRVREEDFCAECIVNDLRPESKLSVKIADKKTASVYKAKPEYEDYEVSMVGAKKPGKTKAAFYETLGGKKRKIGTVRIIVKQAKMSEAAKYNIWYSDEELELPKLYPGDTYDPKDYLDFYYLSPFKSKDYKLTVKSADSETISVNKNNMLRIMKGSGKNGVQIKYKTVFTDGSKLSGSFKLYPSAKGADSSGRFICEKKGENEVRIKRYIGLEEKLTIPEKIDGKAVTSLGKGFLNDGVTEVNIPATVKNINKRAFNYSKVKKITVDSGNKKFSSSDDGVLYNKKKTKLIRFPSYRSLDSYEVPSSVETIGAYAFHLTRVKSIKLPFSVKTIEACAFSANYYGDYDYYYYNSSLKIKCRLESVTLSEGLKTIEEYAFNEAPLKSISFPSTVKKIGDWAFAYTELGSASLPSSLKTVAAGAFYGCHKLKSVTIPEGIKELEESAFGGCWKLKTVKLPKSLKTICADSLGMVESIHLPENVSSISTYAFGDEGMNKIKRITVSKKNKSFSARSNVLYNKNKTELVIYPANREKKDFTIPKTVKSVRRGAFFNSSLRSLTISGSMKKIEYHTFRFCEINKLTIKSGVKAIGREAFESCDIGGSIIIPDSVKKFSLGAFSGCYVKSFKIPKCVGKIPRDGLYLHELKELIIPPHVKSINKYVLMDDYSKPTIKGKKGSAAEKFAKQNKFKFKAIY